VGDVAQQEPKPRQPEGSSDAQKHAHGQAGGLGAAVAAVGAAVGAVAAAGYDEFCVNVLAQQHPDLDRLYVAAMLRQHNNSIEAVRCSQLAVTTVNVIFFTVMSSFDIRCTVLLTMHNQLCGCRLIIS
jgi:hypothetical protein